MIANTNAHRVPLTLELIVVKRPKKNLLPSNGKWIRTSQGHAMQVDKQLPEMCHPFYSRQPSLKMRNPLGKKYFIKGIDHLHLSADRKTAQTVGAAR